MNNLWTPDISETTTARKLNLKIPLDMVRYPLWIQKLLYYTIQHDGGRHIDFRQMSIYLRLVTLALKRAAQKFPYLLTYLLTYYANNCKTAFSLHVVESASDDYSFQYDLICQHSYAERDSTANGEVSACLSVCQAWPSVTRRYHLEINDHRITWFSSLPPGTEAEIQNSACQMSCSQIRRICTCQVSSTFAQRSR